METVDLVEGEVPYPRRQYTVKKGVREVRLWTTIYMAASLGLVDSYISSIAIGDMPYGYFDTGGCQASSHGTRNSNSSDLNVTNLPLSSFYFE